MVKEDSGLLGMKMLKYVRESCKRYGLCFSGLQCRAAGGLLGLCGPALWRTWQEGRSTTVTSLNRIPTRVCSPGEMRGRPRLHREPVLLELWQLPQRTVFHSISIFICIYLQPLLPWPLEMSHQLFLSWNTVCYCSSLGPIPLLLSGGVGGISLSGLLFTRWIVSSPEFKFFPCLENRQDLLEPL